MESFTSGECINGRYRVIRQLGAGAMGTVFLCEDVLQVRRKIALKVLRSDRLEDSEEWSKVEYEALTRLRHPNLARVHDFGRVCDSHDWFIVSEFIRGDDLLGASTTFEEEEFLDVVVQICRALEYIHVQGYVHFDIKPDNILVTRTRQIGEEDTSKVVQVEEHPASTDRCLGPPRVKLIDFGLAEKVTGTFDFAIKGTLHYVAPEIIDGGTPDRRADLYSFGVTLHQILTGRLPFVAPDGSSLGRTGRNWRDEMRSDLKEEPSYLVEIVIRLLEKDPERRFSTAREIIHALSAGAGRHWQVETAETQLSYLYSNRLVGRRLELEHLREGAERNLGISLRDGGSDQEVLHDRPLMLVSGEIGIGKSRLIDEFSHHLKLRELPLYSGNCHESIQDAYHPFRSIVEQQALAMGFDSEIFKKYEEPLRRICPRLKDSDSGAKMDAGDRPDRDRVRFMDRIAAFLEESSSIKPYVMVLNNLHWVDDSSISLLSRLLQRIQREDSPAKIFIIATIRDDEQRSPATAEFLDNLGESNSLDELKLKRFGRTQITELIHHVLQVEEIPSTFLDRFEERTGGNPLFIVEMLKVLQEEGIIQRQGESWQIRGGGDLARVELPAGIHQVLHRRVKVVGEQARSVLRLIALHGKPLPLRLIESIEELGSGGDIRQQVRELEDRGMIGKVIDGGRPVYSILQPKLREIASRDIAPSEARRLHGMLADAIEDQHRADLAPVREELAHHYQLSDHPERAMDHLLAAGDSMREMHAHSKALDHYRDALRQLEQQEERISDWFAVQERIGDAATVVGELDGAEAALKIIQESRIEPEDLTVELELFRVRALRKLGKIEEIRGDYGAALRLVREAAEVVVRIADGCQDREQIRVLSQLSWLHVCNGDFDRAMKISGEGLALAGEEEKSAEHAIFFSSIGSASLYRNEVDQARDFHRRALEIREDLGDVPAMISSLNALSEADLTSGEPMEALELAKQAKEMADEVGDQSGRAISLHREAAVYLTCGDLQQALQCIEDSLSISQQHRMRFLGVRNHLVRGRIRRIQGDHCGAESDLLRALGVHARSGTGIGLMECLLELAELHLDTGDAARVQDELDRLDTILKEIPHEGFEGRRALLEARRIDAAGADSSEVFVLLEKAQRIGRDCGDRGLRAAALTFQAEVHISSRELEESRNCYSEADELHQAFAERLPHQLRDRYQDHHQLGDGPVGEGVAREVLVHDKIEDEEEHASAPEVESSLQERPKYIEEMLRVASLVTEAASASLPRVLIPKALACLVRASHASQGWILIRREDDVRVVCAADASGSPLKGHHERLALAAVEDVWESGKSILAARIVDDPRVQAMEELYSSGVQSLAVIPLRCDGTIRALAYLADPDPSVLTSASGKKLLEAHSGLLGLLLPKGQSVATRS